MAFEAFVSTLEGVQEDHKGFYKEVDGGFAFELNQVGDWGNTSVTGLKGALSKERETNKANAVKLTEYGKFDKYNELGIDGIDNAISNAGKVGTDVKAAVDAKAAEYEEKINALSSANQDLKNKHQTQIVSGTVDRLIASHSSEIADGAVEFFRQKVLSSMSIDDNGSTAFTDMNGNTIMSKKLDDHGNMGADEFWGMIVNDPKNNFALAPSGASGSGSTGSSGGQAAGNPTPAEFKKMTAGERADIYNRDPALARQLLKG